MLGGNSGLWWKFKTLTLRSVVVSLGFGIATPSLRDSTLFSLGYAIVVEKMVV